MVHYKIHLCVLGDSNKFANQAQQLSVGTVIWTESWAFENCPVAFCYWSALTSSSLALELFFLWQPLVLRERKPLLQSFRPLLSLATNHCSRAREKDTYIPQPPQGQVVVAKSLVCPRGWVTRISTGRYIEEIVLEPMFFHFIHVSTLHEKQSLNKHNSHLENDYKTYAAMTIHISNSLETSAVRRLHQEGQNYVQYLSIRQSLAETLYNCRSFLRCITGLKTNKGKNGVWSLLQRLHSWRFCRPMFRNPDSGMRKTFACGILNVENFPRGIRNPGLQSSTSIPESTTWNSESKTVSDSLTWGDLG